MSFDSEDLDEDELLQIALNEQANRKPNPKPNKPVRNYVQQPNQRPIKPTTIPMPKPAAGSGAHRRDVSELDDDESEVEMLSISSGDEDTSKEKAAAGGQRSRAGSGAAGRAGRDDSHWDGGEPDCWKRVDEAELARMVREMREAKAVPVAQKKYEKKPSDLAMKRLTNLQSFPRGMECIDPLGLGIVDNKTLRMISEKSISSPTVGNRDHLDPSIREKLDYFSEKFNAKYFLSRIHEDTSSADLEAGALALKSDLKGRTQQKKQLVKDNFDCFVSCKTTIDDIESKLKRIEEDPEGSGTLHLFDCIQGVSSLAGRAFGPLFERQAQTEKIRSVQGMLQRFRTLFNLPSTIRGNISKGEYDLAVREYRKAKSIVLPSHVGILKRVLEEVEKVMQEFKGMLFNSMEDPNIDLTSLENTVRLLLELEPESDPVWHYLNLQNQRIRGLLERCTLDHEARMDNLQKEMREKEISETKWRQIQQDLSETADIDYPPSFGAVYSPDVQSVDSIGGKVDILRGKYIRRLTGVLTHHIPALWKVALSVSSGKFAKSSQVSDSNADAKTDEKLGDGITHTLEEVIGLLRDTLSAYGSKVHDTFNDLEESNILRPHMTDAIKEISKACQVFEAKESAPVAVVTALRSLQCEITKIYVVRLSSWMRSSTEDISKDESWVPVSILERNKSPYTISSLPLTFRTIMCSAMDQINSMIQSLRDDVTRSEDVFLQLQEIQESLRLAFLNSLLDFAGHLERISGELDEGRSTMETSYFQNGYAHESEERSFDPLPGSVIDTNQRLLMVLSNIGYCKDELAQDLYNKFKLIWLQSRGKDDDGDIQDLVMSFSSLEEKSLAQYTLEKTKLIRSAAVSYLLDAGVQWGAAPAVKGVRDVAVELLHTLVAVHAEVFAGCKPLLDKTLGILVEGLIDTFLSLFHENESGDLRAVDANGFCQLMLELEYFETILNPYFTPEARESLKSLQGVLLDKATESVAEIVKESPSHQRRPTRGSDDVLADDRQQGMTVSPDDLIALAQQYSSDLLQAELERTRINTACFVESFALGSVPESAKAAYASFRNPMDSPSRNYRGTQPVGSGSPSFSRHRRR